MITPIHISDDIADTIARAMRGSDLDAEKARLERVRQLDERRRAIVGKQDRAYDDFADGRISQEFWTRKSEQWETEVQVIDGERVRLSARRAPLAVTAAKNSRTRKTGRKPLQIANSCRTAPIAPNRAIELHVRRRNSLSHLR